MPAYCWSLLAAEMIQDPWLERPKVSDCTFVITRASVVMGRAEAPHLGTLYALLGRLTTC